MAYICNITQSTVGDHIVSHTNDPMQRVTAVPTCDLCCDSCTSHLEFCVCVCVREPTQPMSIINAMILYCCSCCCPYYQVYYICKHVTGTMITSVQQ